MSKKNDLNDEMDWKPDHIQDSQKITSPEIARILLHEDKKHILTLLIQNGEMTIQELSTSSKINPGTIKRHIDDLIRNKLVYKSTQKRSAYNVKMKYYSAVAKKFDIEIKIPEKE